MNTDTDKHRRPAHYLPEADTLASQHAAGTPREQQHAVLTDLLRDWWQPPAELIGTLPGRAGGPPLSYLGHADTTRALIEADPCWTWDPMGRDANGQPVLERDAQGNPVGLWAWLTVCGVTRPCYGSCDSYQREAVKALVSNCIRNGAMRFGIAGALWSKAERAEDASEKPRARKAVESRTADTVPHDEPPPGTAEWQALTVLAPEPSPAQLAEVLRSIGIADRAALIDEGTFATAQRAIIKKYGSSKAARRIDEQTA